jgi:hypothetical protein
VNATAAVHVGSAGGDVGDFHVLGFNVIRVTCQIAPRVFNLARMRVES